MSGPLSGLRLRSRLRAVAIQFLIGATVIAAVVYVTYDLWYPGQLFFLDGGLQGLYILAGVELVLGPGLTFCIYDIAKSRRKIQFDLTVIALLQIAAITWGMTNIQSQRPLALVFAEGSVQSVHAEPLEFQHTSPEDFAAMFPGDPLPVVFSLPPQDKDDLARAFARVLNENLDLIAQVDRMRPLQEHLTEVRESHIDWTKLSNAAAIQAQLQPLAQTAGVPISDLTLLRFRGRFSDAGLVLDKHGKPRGFIDIE